jgi:gliding motility-associated-like protein
MKTGQNIDEVFKNALSNLEADVNPSVWNNIEKDLKVASDQSPLRHFNMRLKNIISFALISGAAILAILYFTSKKPESPLSTGVQKPSQEKPLINQNTDQKIIPSAKIAQEVKNENRSVEGKQPVKAENQKAHTQPVISNVDGVKEKEKKSEQPVSATGIPETKVNVHQEKNSSAKNSSEPSVSTTTSKTAESSNDPNTGSPVIEESNSGQSANSPVFDTESGYSFFIPDRFTPNGDGVNEYLRPDGLNFKDYEIKIYDQVGTEIFSSKDISIAWDGKLPNGKEAASGVYLCRVNVKDLTGKNYLYNKAITLKR